MKDYKRRLFLVGIYGTELKNFSIEDIKDFYDSDCVEIFDQEGLNELRRNYCSEKVVLDKNVKKIISSIDTLFIRLSVLEIRKIMKKIPFKEEYGLRVVDFLVKANDYVKFTDIKESLGLQPKQIWYVVKRLCLEGFAIKKKENNVSRVKIQIDKILDDKNTENKLLQPKIPTHLMIGVQILDQIKDLIRASAVGITSETIMSSFGCSVKRGYQFLSKVCESEPNNFKQKEIHQGKIRRMLFYYVSSGEESKELLKVEKEGSRFITLKDRINCIKVLIEKYKFFYLNECIYSEIKKILKIDYTPDRKTMISSAIKGGFKVYRLNNSKIAYKYIILEKDTDINDLLYDNSKDISFRNEYLERFYKEFVMKDLFVAQDNKFETKQSKRIQALYEYLKRNAINNELLISYQFVNEMEMEIALKIIPFNINRFLDKIYDIFGDIKKVTIDDVIIKNTDMNISKIIKLKLQPKRLMKCITDLEHYGLIEIIPDDSLINDSFKIRLNENAEEKLATMSKYEREVFYIKYKDRIQIFDYLTTYCDEANKDIQDVPLNNEMWRIVYKFIKSNYKGLLKKVVNLINEIFKVNEKLVFKHENTNLQEYLFTKIKHDLFHKKELDYKDYDEDDIQKAVENLKEKGYVVCRHKNAMLSNIELRRKYFERLSKNYECTDENYRIYTDRDTVYNIYFNAIYENLVKKGSLELQELLKICNILEDFEFFNFVKEYDDVFDLTNLEDVFVVSVKLNIDPFDFL